MICLGQGNYCVEVRLQFRSKHVRSESSLSVNSSCIVIQGSAVHRIETTVYKQGIIGTKSNWFEIEKWAISGLFQVPAGALEVDRMG